MDEEQSDKILDLYNERLDEIDSITSSKTTCKFIDESFIGRLNIYKFMNQDASARTSCLRYLLDQCYYETTGIRLKQAVNK